MYGLCSQRDSMLCLRCRWRIYGKEGEAQLTLAIPTRGERMSVAFLTAGFLSLFEAAGLAAVAALSFLMNICHLGSQLTSRRRERCWFWCVHRWSDVGALSAAGLSGLCFFFGAMQGVEDARSTRHASNRTNLARMHG